MIHPRAPRWVLLEELAEAGVDDRLDEAGHARFAELGLRLPSNCGSRSLTEITAVEPLAHVLA